MKYKRLFPREGNYDLIKAAVDNLKFDTFLDVGVGAGGASLYCADHGKKVTSIGYYIDKNSLENAILQHPNITLFESAFETLSLDSQFDAILLSHVLEHTQNVGIFLQKAKDMLNENGWLLVMVPPYKEYVVGGHLSPGWNMGHLMYNLLLSGFNIKDGHFICYGHNICAFVQKSKHSLPKLTMDSGDIETTKEYWPNLLDVHENFDGDINEVNWFENFDSRLEYLPLSKLHKFNTITDLYNFCINLDTTKQYIMFGYREVGKLMLPHLKNSLKAIVERDLLVEDIEGIQVIDISAITKDDYVIITPFKYQLSLKESISKYTSNIILVDI